MAIVIVFNQYSVESCIMAALMKGKVAYSHITAVPFNRVKAGYAKYIWADVTPSKQTLKLLKDSEHEYLGKADEAAEEDEMLFVTDSSLEHVLKFFDNMLSAQEKQILWQITLTVDAMHKAKPTVTISDLATVFCNHQAALHMLYSGETYGVIPGNDQTYLSAIKYLKGKINANLSKTTVMIDKVATSVPILNIDDRLFPWAERILSFSFKRGILYEVAGTEILLHTWNTDKKIVDTLVKQIEKTMLAKMSVRYTGFC